MLLNARSLLRRLALVLAFGAAVTGIVHTLHLSTPRPIELARELPGDEGAEAEG